MYIALEDQTGYLKLLPTDGTWKPGRYKVEIHAGEQINDMSLMGTMRFTITAASEFDVPAKASNQIGPSLRNCCLADPAQRSDRLDTPIGKCPPVALPDSPQSTTPPGETELFDHPLRVL